MKISEFSDNLIRQLPPSRGRIEANVSLSKSTWFRVGGPAEVMFWPADLDDLITFLQNKPDGTAVTMIGIGSNLIVRDGGIPGVVIRLGKMFEEVSINGMDIIAGGGLSNLRLANYARNNGISGFEFLCGIPGSVGGSIKMNAGAYGSEFKEILRGVTALDKKGNLIDLSIPELKYSYRHSDIEKDLIYIGGYFSGLRSAATKITERMAAIRQERGLTQPVRMPTGGSTFLNPPDHKAWKLIDAAGCRDLTRGGAIVSQKHCNFLINTGSASSADLEGLGEEIRHRVFEDCGIKLNWEIKRLGIGRQNIPRGLSA